MLVLSRKEKESIIIDGAIEIIVRRISRGRVVLSLKAPADVSILRGELDRHLGDDSKSGPASVRPPDHSVEACAR